ncbi:MAG: peptidase S41 [Flavobacteriales bacterium]|nr:peptidase S41 [Flavobacteriales bacterium]
MKIIAQIITYSLFSHFSYCQKTDGKESLNLGFETIENSKAVGWDNFGNDGYTISLDPNTVKNGKHSAYIASDAEGSGFKAWGFTLPENYAGKKITLTGYIKTEGISDGYAGLWMRIDPRVAFDNMNNRGIKGTTDWQKYEVTLKMDPEKTTQLVIGGLLVGKGKMWLDDLSITIDKKDISKAKIHKGKSYPADSDKEFDQGSNITHIPSSQHNLESLKALGLIWGFTKYYHPAVAQGDHNIDFELFRVLPKILATKSSIQRDAVLVNWIKSLGNISPGDSKDELDSTEIKFRPDLDWIENSNFSAELKSLLLNLKDAKRSEEHYYIALEPSVGNPNFKHEKAYQAMPYPDAGFRLLALYRYWNIIQYYFPYKNLIKEDWKDVLETFIPKLIAAENETKYHLRMLELIASIHDSHAGLRTQAMFRHFGEKFAATEFTFIENKAVLTGFYNDSLGALTGLQIGDVLLSINEEKVDDFVKRRLVHIPASNYPTQLRNMSANLVRTNNATLDIQYERNGKVESTILNTYSKNQVNIYKRFSVITESYKDISENIAYINNGSLKRDEISEIQKKIKGKKGLIIDIRNYPSDFPIYQLSKILAPSKEAFVKFSKGNIQTPGLFTYTKPLYAGSKNKGHFKGQIVLLINEVSQSSAEFHSMAYQTIPNSIVIGSTTAGADGNISSIILPGGLKSVISGIGVYYPDGKETQRIGIVPDIEVKPSIQGINEGRDELLEKAIELINKG